MGLSLSLFVYLDGSISDRRFRVLTFFYMGAQAFLTLVLQGTSMSHLLRVRSPASRTFLSAHFASTGSLAAAFVYSTHHVLLLPLCAAHPHMCSLAPADFASSLLRVVALDEVLVSSWVIIVPVGARILLQAHSLLARSIMFTLWESCTGLIS